MTKSRFNLRNVVNTLLYLAVVTGMTFSISSCGSIWNVTNPLAVEDNVSTGSVKMMVDNMLGLKINGINVGVKNPEIILPVGKNELEIAMLATPGGGRGVISQFKTIMILGKVQLEIESGKKYVLMASEATVTSLLSIPFGSFVPVGNYSFLFAASNEKFSAGVKFSAVKLDGKDWETYQYPAIQSAEPLP